eukprot:COSAG03_NODE_2198_length_3015_cov_4.299623_1_plen_136_part_00
MVCLRQVCVSDGGFFSKEQQRDEQGEPVDEEVSSKFTFTIAAPSGTNSFNFASNKTAYKLLGFAKESVNEFQGSSLQSVGAVSMMFTDAVYLHCDLLNTNVDKRAGTKSVFHLSTAFAMTFGDSDNDSDEEGEEY